MAEPHHEQVEVISRHRITPEQIDLLALGKHDARTIALLCAAERSRRLQGLRLVLRQVGNHELAIGPLAPVDVAWRMLVTAYDEAELQVSELLNHPQVGVWAAHTLRRLRGKIDDGAPLWFHVGQLHSMACAAAIHAKLPFQLDVPLWDGVAVLPGVGHVRLPVTPGWGIGRVVGNSTGIHAEVTLPGDKPARVEIRRPYVLRGGPGDADLTAQLDDVGPYRGLELPTPPALPEPDIAAWQSRFEGAAKLLHDDYAQWAQELSAGLSVIDPKSAAVRFRPHSASAGDGFGAAIMSEPYDAPQLAITMVHEFQHNKLNAVSHMVRLAREDDKTAECYSPWRDDPRPTMGLFQGIFAFTAVGEFWLSRLEHVSEAERRLADFEFALLRLQISAAVDDLETRSSLTATGRRFVARFRDRTASWHAVEVPDEASDAAGLVALDHRLGWRVSHLLPEPDLVRTAATAWACGDPAPRIDAAPTVLANPTAQKLDVKALLTRVLTTEPAEFAEARSQLTGGGPLVADAGEGDFTLVAGNPAEAREQYVAELSGGSDRPGAWSGLSCATRSISPGSTASSLVRRPEVVAAVHRAVSNSTKRPPDPEDLAAWLDSSS